MSTDLVIKYAPKFKKQYQKLQPKFRRQFDTRVALFVVDRTNPALRVHPLQGKYAGYWSMNVYGDIRALYLELEDAIIIFALIGSHSELYG